MIKGNFEKIQYLMVLIRDGKGCNRDTPANDEITFVNIAEFKYIYAIVNGTNIIRI